MKIHFHVSFGSSIWSLQGLPKELFYCLNEHFQLDKSEWVCLGIIINESSEILISSYATIISVLLPNMHRGFAGLKTPEYGKTFFFFS